MACAHRCVGLQVPTAFLGGSTASGSLTALDGKLCFPSLQHWTLMHHGISKRTQDRVLGRGCHWARTNIHRRAVLPDVPVHCGPGFVKVKKAETHICRSRIQLHDHLDRPCSRRLTVKLLSGLLAAVSWSGGAEDATAFPGPTERRDEEPQVFFKTPSGTKVQELLEGKGPAAQAGDIVSFHYVCRRSNGYYVYSTVDADNVPATLLLGQGQVIQGLEEVLAGMRPGGKRRALIPPSAGYVNPTLEPIPSGFGPQRSLYSHAKEPLVFEVLLLKVK